MNALTKSHTEGGPEVLRSKGSMEDGHSEYGSMVVSECDPEQKAGSCNSRLEYALSELNDRAERVGGTPAPSNCPCTRFCRAQMARGVDGPFPECSPTEHYFYVIRDRYVKSADDDAEWDGDFIPGRHSTFQGALAVVADGHEISRYVVEEVPRFGMFPKWSGLPEDARAELQKLFSPLELMETIAG